MSAPARIAFARFAQVAAIAHSHPSWRLRWLAAGLAVAVAVCLSLTPAGAQVRGPERVEGRVTGEDGTAIFRARVAVTRGPDRLTLTTTTDSTGAYSVVFPQGTGDYLVHVTAFGWESFRQRVTTSGGQSVLRVDAKLTLSPIALAPVTATSERPKPERGTGFGTEPAASEAVVGGVAGSLPPDQAGDLAQIAATVPGLTVTRSGISAFGLTGQSTVTLDGMAFSGTMLPRDARTRTRVAYSTYDPARGGFAAVQTAVEVGRGTTYHLRSGHLTLDSPQLQFSDAAASRLGYENTAIQVSAGMEGPLVLGKYYYNLGLQAVRRTSPAPSLLDAGSGAFRVSGLAPDSVTRIINALGAAGVPLSLPAPTTRSDERIAFIGRVDRAVGAEPRRIWALTAFGQLSRANALSTAPTATPAHGEETRSGTAQLQGLYSVYFGKGYLNDLRTAVSLSSERSSPYARLPEGVVQVASDLGDAKPTVAIVTFGGSGTPLTPSRSWRWESTNETQWYTRASRHKVKLYAQSRFDGWSRNALNEPGSFAFNSLSALEANLPASFVRTSIPGASGGEWTGALAVGDLWSRSRRLALLYGARVESNQYLEKPPFNPAVLEAFGVRTDRAPNTLHVSPRFGFNWIYGGDGYYTIANSTLGSFPRPPAGVLRGGIGEFRNLLNPALLARAQVASGLPGALRQLVCIGPAAPAPDWAAYARDPALVPTECVTDASSPFSDAAPSVELFARDYTAARSWRANLAWTSEVKHVGFTIEGIYSLNLDQPGAVDLNFAGAPLFTLPDEGMRPVFVPASAIVPSTGAVSAVLARRTTAFGRVTEQRSDLRSSARQLTITATPNLSPARYHLSVAYTYSHGRAEQRGYAGTTAGDPRVKESAPAPLSTHQILLQGGVVAHRRFTLTAFARIASGLPYTPIVNTDVNGDGLANDRAFVFDPAAAPTPELAAAMASLLEGGPNCLSAQIGRPAGAYSCRGPWTASTNVRVQFANELTRTGRRVNVSLNLSNPVAGVDRLLHGSDGFRGWGGAIRPDPTLLYVRGFDPATQRFRYEVNPRFGASSANRSSFREPFRITLDISIDWGRRIELQQLDRALAPGRGGRPGSRVTAPALQRRYARNVPDVYSEILENSDSLFLTSQQTAALQDAQVRFRARADSVWAALGTYLAELPDQYNEPEALRKQEEAIDAVWELTRQEGQTIRAVLSPAQFRLLDDFWVWVLSAREKLNVRTYRP